MKIRTNNIFFPLLILSMIFAGCIPLQPVATSPADSPQIEIREIHPPSEHIFTCLDRVSKLSPAERAQDFQKTKEAFIASNKDGDRLELICLSLAQMEKPEMLDYAQELITDMQNTPPSYPDIQGLSALLNDFKNLQQKRIADIRQAQQQVGALKKKIVELKSIEKILNERKNTN